MVSAAAAAAAAAARHAKAHTGNHYGENQEEDAKYKCDDVCELTRFKTLVVVLGFRVGAAAIVHLPNLEWDI